MRIRSRLLTRLAGGTVAFAFHRLAHTLTIDLREERPAISPTNPDCRGRYIYCAWHDVVLMPIMCRVSIRRYTPANRIAALVSQHQDGSYLAEMMRHFTIESIRGSTSRGGARALRQMMDEVREQHVFITPDGPRGPRRQLKDGILFLASVTGLPIVPTGWAAEAFWSIRGSWTDFVIPRPWSRYVGILGTPFVVPPDLPREQLGLYRARLQAEMDRLDGQAVDILRGRVMNETLARAA